MIMLKSWKVGQRSLLKIFSHFIVSSNSTQSTVHLLWTQSTYWFLLFDLEWTFFFSSNPDLFYSCCIRDRSGGETHILLIQMSAIAVGCLPIGELLLIMLFCNSAHNSTLCNSTFLLCNFKIFAFEFPYFPIPFLPYFLFVSCSNQTLH